MTRPNQGLSSLALGGGERETLGTRLLNALRGETSEHLTTDLVSLIRYFYGWQFFVCCFAAFCAATLVKCMKMNSTSEF